MALYANFTRADQQPKHPEVNLRAHVDTAEDGLVRLSLRGGQGNRIHETWHLFDAGEHGYRIHAERYDRNGDLLNDMDGFHTAGEALRWLTNQAWGLYEPDTLSTPNAKVARLLKGGAL